MGLSIATSGRPALHRLVPVALEVEHDHPVALEYDHAQEVVQTGLLPVGIKVREEVVLDSDIVDFFAAPAVWILEIELVFVEIGLPLCFVPFSLRIRVIPSGCRRKQGRRILRPCGKCSVSAD